MKSLKCYIVKKSDISKSTSTPVKVEACDHCGHEETIYPFEPLGTVIPQDVGKMCKKIEGIWYVENQEQFKARLKKEGKG